MQRRQRDVRAQGRREEGLSASGGARCPALKPTEDIMLLGSIIISLSILYAADKKVMAASVLGVVVLLSLLSFL